LSSFPFQYLQCRRTQGRPEESRKIRGTADPRLRLERPVHGDGQIRAGHVYPPGGKHHRISRSGRRRFPAAGPASCMASVESGQPPWEKTDHARDRCGGRQEDGWPSEGAVWRELTKNTRISRNSGSARKTCHGARSLVGNQHSQHSQYS